MPIPRQRTLCRKVGYVMGWYATASGAININFIRGPVKIVASLVPRRWFEKSSSGKRCLYLLTIVQKKKKTIVLCTTRTLEVTYIRILLLVVQQIKITCLCINNKYYI